MGRFEKKGFTMCGAKYAHVSKQFAEQHYIDLAKKPFYNGLTNFLSSGPVMAMCWKGTSSCVCICFLFFFSMKDCGGRFWAWLTSRLCWKFVLFVLFASTYNYLDIQKSLGECFVQYSPLVLSFNRGMGVCVWWWGGGNLPRSKNNFFFTDGSLVLHVPCRAHSLCLNILWRTKIDVENFYKKKVYQSIFFLAWQLKTSGTHLPPPPTSLMPNFYSSDGVLWTNLSGNFTASIVT